jgi:hypothetical protein
MSERPILFSAPMVRAILNGTKTQTRRIVKPPPSSGMRWEPVVMNGYGGWVDGHGSPRPCKVAKRGDLLWVRETWAYDFAAVHAKRDADGPFVYAADGRKKTKTLCGRWRPSIHMPRAASRITLRVTEVRAERLHDMTAADAWAEGIPSSPDVDPSHEFAELWDSLHTSQGARWDDNPWVWCVSFERVSP